MSGRTQAIVWLGKALSIAWNSGLSRILNMEIDNRISWDPEKIEDLLIDLFVETMKHPKRLSFLTLQTFPSMVIKSLDFSMMTTIASPL
jgi:hypothetical protein